MKELIEARVQFLHTLADPTLKVHLNSYDMVAFMDLFSEHYQQMFPSAD
jgi:hypothetical protein